MPTRQAADFRGRFGIGNSRPRQELDRDQQPMPGGAVAHRGEALSYGFQRLHLGGWSQFADVHTARTEYVRDRIHPIFGLPRRLAPVAPMRPVCNESPVRRALMPLSSKFASMSAFTVPRHGTRRSHRGSIR